MTNARPETTRSPDEKVPIEPTDGALLERIRAGSESAAAHLYFRYDRRLRALARAKSSPELARRIDAEDIVQSVFRSFFRLAGQGYYDVPAGNDLWNLLLVIALNKVRAAGVYHHAAKRDVRATTELDAVDSRSESVADPQTDRALLDLVLRDSLTLIPEPYRQIVEWRMAGHNVADISRKVNRSMRTVERSLQQARTLLRALLDKEP